MLRPRTYLTVTLLAVLGLSAVASGQITPGTAGPEEEVVAPAATPPKALATYESVDKQQLPAKKNVGKVPAKRKSSKRGFSDPHPVDTFRMTRGFDDDGNEGISIEQDERMRARVRARTVYETYYERIPKEELKSAQEYREAVAALRDKPDDTAARTRVTEANSSRSAKPPKTRSSACACRHSSTMPRGSASRCRLKLPGRFSI
jgi:hypothetical protein